VITIAFLKPERDFRSGPGNLSGCGNELRRAGRVLLKPAHPLACRVCACGAGPGHSIAERIRDRVGNGAVVASLGTKGTEEL
jgi:hypothetical protein